LRIAECGTQLKTSSGRINKDKSAPVTCQTCNRIITRSDLIAANGENIDTQKTQIKDKVAADLKKQFQDAFKGNKSFKLK
jgi:hypothetical protein